MQRNSPCDTNPRSMHLTSKKTAARNPEAVRPGSPVKDHRSPVLLPVAGGVTMRNDAELQAKSATVKSWACVNFSCIGSEELLKFLRSLGRVCVKNGMDFSLEPTMLVHMSSSCRADLPLGLYIVKKFFQTKGGDSRFLLVILPDDRHSDEKIEKICKDIGVVYQCLLPLFGCISPYLDIVTNEIKAKVINSCNDTSGGLMAGYEGFIDEEMVEYDGYDNEEMREYDGYNNEEMGDDDGNSCGEMGEDVCNEMESLQLCSSDNELCKYTSKERRSEASHSNGSPDGEIGEQQLLSAEDFTTMTDGILQAKSVNVTWACVNFSCLSGKEILRFLCNLGKMCTSIGMDLSPEPSILIHLNSTRETDFGACLWTVFQFFNGFKNRKTLVIIILPDAKYYHVNVERVCGNLGLVYQLCLPRHARRASEEYLKNAANKIKAKVLFCFLMSCVFSYLLIRSYHATPFLVLVRICVKMTLMKMTLMNSIILTFL